MRRQCGFVTISSSLPLLYSDNEGEVAGKGEIWGKREGERDFGLGERSEDVLDGTLETVLIADIWLFRSDRVSNSWF